MATDVTATLTSDFQNTLAAMHDAGSELNAAREELMTAYRDGASSEDLEVMKMEFEDKQQRFKVLQAITDVIAKLRDSIINRIGQIGR